MSRIASGLTAILLIVLAAHAKGAPPPEVTSQAELATPVVLAGEAQRVYLRVLLHGFDAPASSRAPVNVAIVLDKSGSMDGEKLAKAQEAAIGALGQLGPEDVVSVVLYDSTVNVLSPAAKMRNPKALFGAIRGIQAHGDSALFAGVSKGAAEVRKFETPDRLSRIVLLSDGRGNVGPTAPEDLADLGASLACQGISVSTIGLGYDYHEDLMADLARGSNGSHLFAPEAADLDTAFAREFGDVLTAVAQEATIRLTCAGAVRPLRVLGREGRIDGAEVTVNLGQIFSRQDKYAVIEVELPPGSPGQSVPVGRVDVACANLYSNSPSVFTHDLAAAFTDDPAEVDRRMNASAMASAVRQLGVETNALARGMRDQGRTEEAKQLFMSNESVLIEWGNRLNAPQLLDDALSNTFDARNLDDAQWPRQRKQMVDKETDAQLQALGYNVVVTEPQQQARPGSK